MSEYADWVRDGLDDEKPDWAWRCEECNAYNAVLREEVDAYLCDECSTSKVPS